jgi:hypothetical protein
MAVTKVEVALAGPLTEFGRWADLELDVWDRD